MISLSKVVYNLKYNWNIHSFLIIIYFLLSSFNNHFDEKQIIWVDFLKVVSFTIIFIIAIWLFQKKLKYNQEYFILLSLTLCVCLFYSTLINLHGNITFNALLIPFEILVVYFIFFYYLKKVSSHWKIRFYLNCYFIILCTIELSLLPKKEVDFVNDDKQLIFSNSTFKEHDQLVGNENNPNIYILFYDGYANEKNLTNYFNFDNSLFIKQIKSKGFYYVPNSHSNYNQTLKTWASFLNLGYLKTNKEIDLLSSIKFNLLTEYIFKKAYNIVNLSPFQIEDNSNYNSYDLMFGNASLSNHLYVRTIFFKFERFLKYHILGYKIENNKIALLTNIMNAKPNNKPNLVLYHSMITHYPYQFDENGNHKLELFLHGVKQRMQDYLTQLKYTNKLINQTIDNILLKQPNSIIVIASDHGYRQIEGQSLKLVEQESFENFCAFYFPDKKYNMLYDSISVVNIFRIVVSKIKKDNPVFVKDIQCKSITSKTLQR